MNEDALIENEARMDEGSLFGHLKVLQICTQEGSALSEELQLEITRAVVDYLVSRLNRGIPNEGTVEAIT